MIENTDMNLQPSASLYGADMRHVGDKTQVITSETVRTALETLHKYKDGKTNLESKIVENEEWYKKRNIELERQNPDNQIKQASGWLVNALLNKHADCMDNFPMPNILPREQGDKAEATILSAIIPVILEHNDFEQVYSDVAMYKIKTGTGVYGVFWDGSKLNGLGDIAVNKIDLLNLFWEPGVTDIQKSRNLFHVEIYDNDELIERYPQLAEKLTGNGAPTIDIRKYIYDDSVPTDNKTAVVDWYYKRNVGGKTILHYVKFANDVVLFATENSPEYANTGWYEHGQYPFVFDTLYPVEGTPTGFGYIDLGKSTQEYIDRCNALVLENMFDNATPRYFFRDSCGVKEEEFTDRTKRMIHCSGNLGEDAIREQKSTPLDSVYYNIMTAKVDELKEVTGNRDVSTGGTQSGVTAASAIAAMQEAGSKLSRDNNKAAYRAYRRMITLVLELIRQFYDLPRQFRIVGEDGAEDFVQYSNAGIKQQQQDGGMRSPVFDIQVSAEKASPYSRMSQNELALQFYNAGFFNPQLADQALACLDMMDFDRKNSIMQKIQQNGTMFMQMQAMQQQMLALGAMVDHYKGGDEVTQGLMAQFGMQDTGTASGGKVETDNSKSITDKAREQTANATAPA